MELILIKTFILTVNLLSGVVLSDHERQEHHEQQLPLDHGDPQPPLDHQEPQPPLDHHEPQPQQQQSHEPQPQQGPHDHQPQTEFSSEEAYPEQGRLDQDYPEQDSEQPDGDAGQASPELQQYIDQQYPEQRTLEEQLEDLLPQQQPLADQTPSEQPPSDQTPSEQPPSEQPSSEQLPSEQPPSEQSSSEQPPSEQPPSEQPPFEPLPSEQLPSEQLLSEQPLSEQLPSEQPLSEQPLSEQLPSEQLPSEQMPSKQPPSEQPPSEQPPSEQSPSEHHLSEQPPSEPKSFEQLSSEEGPGSGSGSGSGHQYQEYVDSTTPITATDPLDHTITEPQFIPSNERPETGMTVTAALHNSTVNITITPTKSEWRCYTVRVSAYYEDTFHQFKDLHNEEYVYSCQPEFQVRNFSFQLPDELLYFDGQDPGNATNYYVHKVQVYVVLMSSGGDLLHDKHTVVDLVEPWSRPARPRYCGSWGFDLLWRVWWMRLPQCERTYDVNLFSTVVAIPGNEIGFTKTLPPRRWPSHAPEHVKTAVQSDTRFTVTMWVYITSYCAPNALCLIIQHRHNGSYHTPLILINEHGSFHVQLHHEDGSAIAFLSSAGTPKQTWIFLVLGIGGVRAELSLSFADRQSSREYVHIGAQPFFFNASTGIMAIGGHMGQGMSGYLGPVDLYRDKQMHIKDALRNTSPVREKLEALKIREQAEDCDWLKPRVCRLVLGHNVNNERYCSGKYWNSTLPPTRPSPRSHLHVDNKVLSGYLLRRLREVLWKRKQVSPVYRLEDFSKLLYKRSLKLLERQTLATPVISRLFEISGCLGDPKGYYAAAVIQKYGFGMKVNIHKAHQLHLIAAHEDYSLAQLALAYRHQLGIDGSPKDISVMAGYLRATAVTTKAIIEREEQTAVTHSEMIRLDQAHNFRNQRGSDSQVVKWLTHQANMGSEEAQTKMAEILYHGREGANVDRNQAVQFYRMAAARNDPSALFNLGVMNLKGINMEKNETKAYEFFKKAAAHNNSIAYNAIAFVELSVNHNKSGAVHYWKKAADMGDGDGLNNYAIMLEQGIKDGEPANHSGALKYYEMAALKGSKNAAIRFADYKIDGVHTKRDVQGAAAYYRFVADQLNDMGLCLKEAINAYLDDDWYLSLFHHLLANEAGLQLAGYNTALLLQQHGEELKNVMETSDPYHYFNLTAEQGWSLSLIAMGHQTWYNKSEKRDLKKASLYYARSIENNNHPEGLYNLAYIVEHGYPLHGGIQVQGIKDFPTMNRNLSMALQLYLSCANSTTDEQEGYYPCQLAALWIQWKIFLLTHQQIYYLVALVPVAVASIITYIKLH